MWTRCSLYWFFLWTSPIVLGHTHQHRRQKPTEQLKVNLVNNDSKTIFSQETFLHSTTSFDCEEKPDGYYTFIEEDCLVYHTCKTISKRTKRRLKSTHLCPLGTKYDITSTQCISWEKVNCKTEYRALPIETDKSFMIQNPNSVKYSRKKRATYTRNLSRLSKDRINNVPHDCYWCCKPSRPIIRPENQIWSPQTTSRPWTTTTRTTTTTARTTTRYWWYPSTTETPTTKFWWYPTTTKRPNLWQQKPFPFEPEVIEAKKKSSNSGKNTLETNLISPAYDVVFKFKRFFGMAHEPDDAIVIEDNYSPEVIEAIV